MAARARLPVLLRRQPAWPLIASLGGWAMLWVQSQALLVPALCMPAEGSAPGWRAVLDINPPAILAGFWIAMLLAMMPPLLVDPLAHLWYRSLTRRRFRAIALFVAGYALVWLAVGSVLMLVALALRASTEPGLVLAIAVAVALAWQATPLKQRFLNGCHRQPPVAAFGIRADLGALTFGVTHGSWCAGACWALMLLPLSAGDWHWPVMLAVMLWTFGERNRWPQPARWTIPVLSLRAGTIPSFRSAS